MMAHGDYDWGEDGGGNDGEDEEDDLVMAWPKLKSSQGCSIAHEFWAAGQHWCNIVFFL